MLKILRKVFRRDHVEGGAEERADQGVNATDHGPYNGLARIGPIEEFEVGVARDERIERARKASEGRCRHEHEEPQAVDIETNEGRPRFVVLHRAQRLAKWRIDDEPSSRHCQSDERERKVVADELASEAEGRESEG